MDRLTQLKGEAGGSRDSTADTSALSEAYITANDSSKYFSLGEENSSFDISPIKDVSLASTASPDKSAATNDQLMSNLSPKKNDLLDSYKFGKQIEAANILSGGVNIFDDNDNSYDGNELVIDDNVVEIDEKSNPDMKLMDSGGLPFQKSEESESVIDGEPTIGSKDTEVVLQIDGNNVQAIDIGNGLYLYRKQGEEELAAVQIQADHDQPSFKFLKVRENSEGNLEVYEEIEIEVPKEVPTKEGKVSEKNASHVPIKDINKVINDPAGSKIVESVKPLLNELPPITSTEDIEDVNKIPSTDSKSGNNVNSKMIKINETRKSPVIHSTPNKEGIPLTKTMVDLKLHTNRQLDNLKTIEVHTDCNKLKLVDTQTKNKDSSDSNNPEISLSDKQNLTKLFKDVTKLPNDKIDVGTLVASKEEMCKRSEELLKKDLHQNENKNAGKTSQDSAPVSKIVSESYDEAANVSNENPTIQGKEKTEVSSSETELTKNPETPKIDIESSKITDVKENINVKEPQNTVDQIDLVCRKSLDTTMCIKSDNKVRSLEETKENPQIKQQDIPNRNVNEEKNKIYDKKPVSCKEINVAEAIEGPGSLQKESLVEIELSSAKNEKDCKTDDIVVTQASNVDKKPEKTLVANVSDKIIESQIEVGPSNGQQTKTFTNTESNRQPIIKEKNIAPNLETIKVPDLPHTEKKFEVKEKIDQLKSEIKPDKNKSHTNIVVEDKPIPITDVKEKPVEADTKKPTADTKIKLPMPVSGTTLDLSKNESKVKSQHNIQSVEKHAQPAHQLEDTKQCKQEVRKSDVIPQTVHVQQSSPEIKPEIPKNDNSNQKPINNNHAPVPFGKWTEANRQAFLNKIKESKVPTNYPNTKSIKQPNDLNRRDVLQKIDSQRQSSNSAVKTSEPPKLNVKAETVTFTKKPVVPNRESKVPVKVGAPNEHKMKSSLNKNVPVPDLPQVPPKHNTHAVVSASKQEGKQRKEINNQDLIDKTIEGIINRAVCSKPQESKQNIVTEGIKPKKELYTASNKPKEIQSSNLDAIEIKMNELHGIPFVERPPHELPTVYNHDIKTYSKADTLKLTKSSKIPNLLPFTNTTQSKQVMKETIVDLDSEEEVIEHEPITGAIDLPKKNISKPSGGVSSDSMIVQRSVDSCSSSSKIESIITEKDFDKFARRNSVTYENCLTMKFEVNKQSNMPQAVPEKDVPAKISRNELMLADSKAKAANKKLLFSQTHSNRLPMPSKLIPISDDGFSKNYPSKLQMAYTALTAKRKVESPITIIEDKPVKVVFMDANPSFPLGQLNVQGKELSPTKKLVPELDSITTDTGDSLDSDVLDAVDGVKVPDELKTKTKHQRKQVLTPVEAPELELIAPSDLGLEASPKKKRKTDDTKFEKNSKSVVPKKTYLLGRSAVIDNIEPQSLTKSSLKETVKENTAVVSHNNAASAIDNLVKAAELLETQPELLNVSNVSANVVTTETTPIATPVKRGRGRPRKYPLPGDNSPDKTKAPSSQKKPRLVDEKQKQSISTTDEEDSIDDAMVKENWTMGRINENIVCPICNKLFRSENVVFKHVKHCTGPSPNRSDSDKRSPRRTRFSRESDSKSMESKSDNMESEQEKPVITKNTPKKRKSKELSHESKEDVIVIEDTPAKAKPDKNEEPKQRESRKITKTKAQYKTSPLSCEHCGKTFRQLSYLVSHKLLHKKENTKVVETDTMSNNSVFSCEVCQKQFRKLHHLVQHRIIHNPSYTNRSSRKSSSEQNNDNKGSKDQDLKQNEDLNAAAFRCEPCDKSFRKLHHLVEHRETHDGINRQKNTTAQSTVEKTISNPPPQCDICKKTFRKLHHLIEHKEQHVETSSEKSDDKSVKSSLSTKDIIHECSLCYMVFPNEHSLNKHTVICQRKKRQSALKQAKQEEEKSTENVESKQEESLDSESEPIIEEANKDIITTQTNTDGSVDLELKSERLINKGESVIDIVEKRRSREQEYQAPELKTIIDAVNVEKPNVIVNKDVIEVLEIPQNNPEKIEATEVKPKETPKKNSVKEKKSTLSAVRRRKSSNVPLARIKEAANAKAESSDDDEHIRYMLNPDFKEESSGEVFMKVRAKKRNSLQFERPNSKDVRRSLPHCAKIPRLKSKEIDVIDKPVHASKAVKTEPVPSTDSDDSDVKYSFPEKPIQNVEPKNTPKEKRKAIVEKRKTPGVIARRKSLVTTKLKVKATPNKTRRAEAEYRCDCGQLFSSAALLARHATLAHTPPRVRRPRPPPPSPTPPTDEKKPAARTATVKPEARKSTAAKSVDQRKSSAQKQSPGGKSGRSARKAGRSPAEPAASAASAAKLRKSTAHRGVPVPEKMRKLLEKQKK